MVSDQERGDESDSDGNVDREERPVDGRSIRLDDSTSLVFGNRGVNCRDGLPDQLKVDIGCFGSKLLVEVDGLDSVDDSDSDSGT